MNIVCIISFLSTCVILSAQEEWLDPHDMNTKFQGIPSEISNGQFEYNQLQPYTNCPKEINFSISHYKRLINMILSATTDDKSGVYKGHLYLNIAPEDYDILKTFANDDRTKEDSAVLRKLDQILSKTLSKPLYEQAINIFASWMDYLYFLIYSRTTIISISCLFLAFISYKLLKENLTIWSVVKYLIFVGWITDFAFTWINLLQEAEINRMADSLMYESVPPHCNPNKMSFWQYLQYSLGSKGDCRNYHQTIFKDIFWSVAPVTVLSHQFGVLIYTPASHLGQALGAFTSALLNSLPWGINIVLLPCLLLFVAILICISFSFVTQTTFSLDFLHIVRLKFGNEQRRTIGDLLTGPNLNAILNIAQRNMVEDVRQVESSKTDGSDSSNSNKSQTKGEPSNVGDNKEKETKSCETCECHKSEGKQIEDIKSKTSNEEVKHDGSGDK